MPSEAHKKNCIVDKGSVTCNGLHSLLIWLSVNPYEISEKYGGIMAIAIRNSGARNGEASSLTEMHYRRDGKYHARR